MFIVKKDSKLSQGSRGGRFFSNTKALTAAGVFIAIKLLSAIINKPSK